MRYWEPTPSGKWREKWESTKSTEKKDVETLRRKIERRLEGKGAGDGRMAWETFVDEFVTNHASRKSHDSVDLYRRCLKTFGNVAKPLRISDVTTGVLEDFVNARLADEKSPATVNKELRHVKAALRWALRREYIDRLPNFTGAFVREDAKRPTVIPEGDFVAMVAALKTGPALERRTAVWWRVFLYLAYYVGLRRGELLGLTWDCVWLDSLEIVVKAGTSKSRKDRVVPMTDDLAGVLREWRDRQSTLAIGGAVLPWPYATYRQLYKDWHVIQTAAGIPEGQHYVPHHCRSSCASALLAAGNATAVVKDILGHQAIATTERHYINGEPAMRAAVLKRKVALA